LRYDRNQLGFRESLAVNSGIGELDRFAGQRYSQIFEPMRSHFSNRWNLIKRMKREKHPELQNSCDRFYIDLQSSFREGQHLLESHLKERAEIISIKMCRRFAIPLNKPGAQIVRKALEEYAVNLAGDFVAKTNSFFFSIERSLNKFSRWLGVIKI
jgi:hypothetical protein